MHSTCLTAARIACHNREPSADSTSRLPHERFGAERPRHPSSVADAQSEQSFYELDYQQLGSDSAAPLTPWTKARIWLNGIRVCHARAGNRIHDPGRGSRRIYQDNVP